MSLTNLVRSDASSHPATPTEETTMPNDEMYADSALALAAPPTGAPIPEQFLDEQRVAQGAITIATPVTAPLPPLPEAPAVRPRVKHGVEARGVGRGRGKPNDLGGLGDALVLRGDDGGGEAFIYGEVAEHLEQ